MWAGNTEYGLQTNATIYIKDQNPNKVNDLVDGNK